MFRFREPSKFLWVIWQSSEKVNLAKRTVSYLALNPKNLEVEQLTLNTNSNTLAKNIKDFGSLYETAKLANSTILYPALNPKKMDVEQLTLTTNCNTLN